MAKRIIINDFLNRCLLASETFRRLPAEVYEKRHSEDGGGSYNICPAFLSSAALYILDRCFCSLPINLLAVFVVSCELCALLKQ